MKKYFFFLIVIAAIVAANYFYVVHNKIHVVLINNSKKSVPAGTPIFFKGIKVGAVKEITIVNDSLVYAQTEFEKGVCIGSATNFILAPDTLANTLELEMVNNNEWDPCLANDDTAFIIADTVSKITLHSLFDSTGVAIPMETASAEYPDSFKFTWPIDSIRCYCWCMVDATLDTVMRQNRLPCATDTKVPPSSIAKSSNYKYTITSKGKLQEFQDLLSTGHIRKYDLGFDARFSFVMFTVGRSDTISLYSHRYMALGNTRIISFDTDIKDDLKHFLNGLNIDCRDAK